MSSRKRRERMQHGDAFDAPESAPSSLQDFADKLYSTGGLSEDLKKIDAKTVRIKNVPVDKVRPDPTQARRVMPAALRGVWLRDPISIHKVLQDWLEMVDAEAVRRGRPLVDVPALLDSDPEASQASNEEERVDPNMGPMEGDFRAMLQLAASIRHHGLANPITVVQGTGDTYVVETGERRLLAYNLLQSLPDIVEGDWATIPSRVVDSKSVWRQAAENGARQNLNAISIARQLALLLMDVYSRRHKFLPYDDMPGVDWYAQVADSKLFPIPYGRGNELAAAMGLRSGGQLRHYRQLLRLPNEVWEIADECNWAEGFIRFFLQDAREVIVVQENMDDKHKSVTIVTDSKNSHISKNNKVPSIATDLWLDAIKESAEARRALLELAQQRANVVEDFESEATHPREDEESEKPAKPKSGQERFLQPARHGDPKPKTMVKKAGAQLVKYDPRAGTVTFRLDDPPDTKKIPSGGRWVVTLQYVEDPSAAMDEIIYDHFNPADEDEE